MSQDLIVPIHVNTDDCWLWAGITGGGDYGRLWVKSDGKGRYYAAHRVVYESEVGLIPEGLVMDHLCRVPRCVNPEHLEPVTNYENIIRGIRGIITVKVPKPYCKHGHKMTPENTRIAPDKYHCVLCVTCYKQWNIEFRARRREEKRKRKENIPVPQK